MELIGSEGELSSGYKLVPWSSWDQWNFVRISIFSSSHDNVAAALRRISVWRSRGCLPIPIDVTASLAEIQQKDPFFRLLKNSEEDLTNGTLESDEMLSMLYSMAIIRLVNCFVAHKRTRYSISELADAVGIPRVLVDIRHESSHRDLPSLQLLRGASTKALDWLKVNYWERQRNEIPDVRREIRSRFLEMSSYLRTKNTKRTRSMKQVSKILKIIARLYTCYPHEVVSVMLDFFQQQTNEPTDDTDMENSKIMQDFKIIVVKLSSKRPRLLLSMLRSILEMIETKFDKIYYGEININLSQNQAETDYMIRLCSLLPWLIMNLKSFKYLGLIEFADETEGLSIHTNGLPKVSLCKLLKKCLSLSLIDNKYILDSVSLLTEMIGDVSVKERLKKLPLLRLKDSDPMGSPNFPDTERMLLQEEDAVRRATENLAIMKLKRKAHSKRKLRPCTGDSGSAATWTVVKSWTSCPIGMLPCSFSSTPVLPDLDKVENAFQTEVGVDKEKNLDCYETNAAHLDHHTEILDNGNPTKKLKESQPEQCNYFPQGTGSLEGLLLINGIWTKSNELELQIVESKIFFSGDIKGTR